MAVQHHRSPRHHSHLPSVKSLVRENLIVASDGKRPRYAAAPGVPEEALRELATWTLRDRTDPLDSMRLNTVAAGALPQIRDIIVRHFKPLKLIVFGSHARGEAREESDIDLLVVMPEGTKKLPTSQAIYGALAPLQVAKDIVITSPNEIEEYGALYGTVLRDALSEGVTIYGEQ